MDGLMTSRIFAAHRGYNFFFLIAGTIRIGIAVDDPDDIGPVGFVCVRSAHKIE